MLNKLTKFGKKD